MSILVIILCAILFCCFFGVYDAILYGRKGADSFTWNEHIIGVALRSAFPLCILLGMWAAVRNMAVQIDFIEFATICWCFMFLFSYWHNGCYYVAQALIAKQPFSWRIIKKYWKSYSFTDTSIIHFNYTWRFVMFMISIVTVVIYELIVNFHVDIVKFILDLF